MKSCVVKRKNSASSFMPLVCIALASLLFSVISMSVFVYIPILVLIVGIIAIIYFTPHFLRCEYEYNLEGESFSVALIRNKSSRKELFSCDISHLVSCEPYKSQRIVGEKVDVSSCDNTPFIATFSEEGKQATVLFSPDDEFVREFRLLAPSKVKLNIMW